MSDRISPPSWTEWTRNPSERSPQRKTFDDLLGELRKEGLIEVRGSLFVHLAKYSYMHVKSARVEVAPFLQSVPESILGAIPPNYRRGEVDGMFQILEEAGLASVLEERDGVPQTMLLTERQAPGEVARGQVVHSVLTYLRELYQKWNPADLVLRASSFPSVESVGEATGVDRGHLIPGDGCTAVQDRPETNETNETPFLQETIDQAEGALVLLQFWPMPDPKAGPTGGADPEFSILIPGDLALSTLVRDQAIPVLAEFFRSNDHHDLAAEVQAKYGSYMHKYREKFASAAPVSDRIDKVLTGTDPEGEPFANAVYVVVQVLKSLVRTAGVKTTKVTLVYQAARIAYAHAMALRVRKRKEERESAARTQDSSLLVTRLKESPRPLTLDDLKKTPDGSRQKDIGSKYSAIIDLLPLAPPKDGTRPTIFEVRGAFLHRENLIRSFLDLRDREAIAQRERLAQDWAREGIPTVEELFLADRDVSADFLRVFELLHTERIVAPNNQDFLRDFLPDERELYTLARWIWPDGYKGGILLSDILRGIDQILYEDKDRLRRRSLVGVLGLSKAYEAIVKAAWNIVFMEEGLFRFILRKVASWFGGKPSSPAPEAKAKKKGSSAPVSEKKGGADPRAQKAADLKKLKDLAPLLEDKEELSRDREKAASQWCFKLDPEANRRTRQAVDDEIARLVPKIALDQLSEENGAKVALFLVEKSSVLEQVTSSRAFHRYLYLTALQKRAEVLTGRP